MTIGRRRAVVLLVALVPVPVAAGASVAPTPPPAPIRPSFTPRTPTPAAAPADDDAAAAALEAAAPDGAPVASAALAGAPHVNAATDVLVEASTGLRLAAKGADTPRPMASTTKLMTALLTLERAPLSRVVSAPSYAAGAGESLMNLGAGERISIGDLLTGMLLPSANDAAHALAVRVGGSVPAFVAAMNRRAGQLGLRHTHYGSPVGLDDGLTHSSAADLVRLAIVDLRVPFFRRTVARRFARVGLGANRRTVVNRNTALGLAPWVNGVKTGHTSAAGYVLVASGTVGGVTLVDAVMADPSEGTRDADAVALLRFGFSRIHRVEVARAGALEARLPVSGRPGTVDVVAGRPLRAIAVRGVPLRRVLRLPAHLRGPLPAGARVGELIVRLEGHDVGRVPLRLRTAIPAPSALATTLRQAGTAGAGLGGLALVLGTILHVRRRRSRPRALSARSFA